jgi:hypothetical protein
MQPTTRRLVRLTVAARQLRLPHKWLRAEAAAGRIPCLRAGDQILCDVEAVEAALLERARLLSPSADGLLDDQTPGDPPGDPGRPLGGLGTAPEGPGDSPEDPRGLAGEKHRENTAKSPRSTFSKKDRKKGQLGFDHDVKTY